MISNEVRPDRDGSKNPLRFIDRSYVAGRLRLAVGGLIGLMALPALGQHEWSWKNYAVVEPGRVYRSGQLKPEELTDAIRRLKLRTVISLNTKTADAERKICRSAGASFLSFDMPADGLGSIDDFRSTLTTLRDSTSQPVMIHCHAGVARTGAAAALYRVIEQGWSVDRAIDELKGFEKRGRIDPSLDRHVRMLADRLKNSASRR